MTTPFLHIVGRWGAGTSLVAAVAAEHGYHFGTTGEPNGRCKHGIMEDINVLHGMAHHMPTVIEHGLERIARLAREEGKRPALKMPWLLVRPGYWDIVDFYAPPERIIWVRRPTKPEEAYTMHKRFQKAAVVVGKQLQERWAKIDSIDVYFENLILHPHEEIRRIAAFIDADMNEDAVSLVDPNWMRNKIPTGGAV